MSKCSDFPLLYIQEQSSDAKPYVLYQNISYLTIHLYLFIIKIAPKQLNMNKVQIIGLTGLNGSGKGSAAEHYSKEYGFKAYNTREYIIELLTNDHLPVDRPHMVIKANEMREKYGPQYFAEYFIHKAKKEKADYFTIDSIRNPEEAHLIKSLQGKIVLIETLTEVRYTRIKRRESQTDFITYEEFLEQEIREMNSSNPNHQNMQEVFKMADHIANNSHYFGFFKSGLDAVLEEEEIEEEKESE